MDPAIIAAIIGVVGTIAAAIVSLLAARKRKSKSRQSNLVPNMQESIYEDMRDAFRLGIGAFGLVTAAVYNSAQFKTDISSGHEGIERLLTKLLPPQRFSSVHSLMKQAFTSGDYQNTNALHEGITNAIFDSHSPVVQIAYIFGAYIPILKGFDSNPRQMEAPLSIVLNVLAPLRGTVYKASPIIPSNIINLYKDILKKRKVASAASRITDWFMGLPESAFPN